MIIKELVRRLKLCNQNKPIKFYFLKDADLSGCEYETLLEMNEQVELTIKLNNSDEMGSTKKN